MQPGIAAPICYRMMLKHRWTSTLSPVVSNITRYKMSTAQGTKIMFGPFEVTSQVSPAIEQRIM